MEFKRKVLSGYMDLRVTSIWMIIKAMGRRQIILGKTSEEKRGPRVQS